MHNLSSRLRPSVFLYTRSRPGDAVMRTTPAERYRLPPIVVHLSSSNGNSSGRRVRTKYTRSGVRRIRRLRPDLHSRSDRLDGGGSWGLAYIQSTVHTPYSRTPYRQSTHILMFTGSCFIRSLARPSEPVFYRHSSPTDPATCSSP